MAGYHIWLSQDRGKTWKRHATVEPDAGNYVFQSPRDGHYWLRIQSESKSGVLDPPTLDHTIETLKVYINARRLPVIRPQGEPGPSARQAATVPAAELQQLQREVKELRALVETLRKRIADLENDRKPER
jgi:hypothetical protein